MNIWEHTAAMKAGELVADALPVAEKAAKAVEHEVKVVAEHNAPVAEGLISKAVHAVEHALHIGSQGAESATGSAAPPAQAPAAAPQEQPAQEAAPAAQDRKAELLAELHKLEDEVQHLGG